MNKPNKSVSKRIGDESIEEKAPARILNFGLDLHYRQVTTGTQEDGGRITPLGKMCYERFVHRAQKKLAEGFCQRSFWCHTGNRPAAMATVNAKILVGRQYNAIGQCFSHTHQASVGETHGNVGVLLH